MAATTDATPTTDSNGINNGGDCALLFYWLADGAGHNDIEIHNRREYFDNLNKFISHITTHPQQQGQPQPQQQV